MECFETGQHQAVRLKHLTLDVAKNLDDLIGALRDAGHGNGSLLMTMVNGRFPHIDISTRRHLNCKKTRLQSF